MLLCDGRCVLAARADAAATLSPVGMRGERNFGPYGLTTNEKHKHKHKHYPVLEDIADTELLEKTQKVSW